jgi:hypothetical protein
MAIATLAALPVLADTVPTQTPAQLKASTNPPPAPQMPSQADKAEATQSGKAQLAANDAASNANQDADQGISLDKTDQGRKESTGPVTEQQIEEKAAVDNGVNDGGAAAQTLTP